MRKELSSFIRDAVLANAARSVLGPVRPQYVDFDHVADDVLARMDELKQACSMNALDCQLIDERAADRGSLQVWR